MTWLCEADAKAHFSCSFVQIIITTSEADKSAAEGKVLHVSYAAFPGMCMKGDTIFLGKYLVTGSEESSLYLTVCLLTARPPTTCYLAL